MRTVIRRMPRTTLGALLCALLWPPLVFVLAIVAFPKGISNHWGIAGVLFILFAPTYAFLLRALQLEFRARRDGSQSGSRRAARLVLITVTACWLLILVLYGALEAWFLLSGGFAAGD